MRDASPPRPERRPANPRFSSGPCAKRPGWTPDALAGAAVGRYHRSSDGAAKLRDAVRRTRELLQLPDTHRVAIVPGSDTGAMEMALWSLLGRRGVDVLAWEAFGLEWVRDLVDELALPDVRTFVAPYGDLPNLASLDFARDVVFPWNGTTSGVRVPSADFIPPHRDGLTICDATSGVFAQRIDWTKLDVATFSWQKALGGEAAHGMLVLSDRAIARLESEAPPRALPKLFRLTRDGRMIEGLFDGAPLNTPSLLCVEDCLDALGWAEKIGGLDALVTRADRNAGILADWVADTPWIDHLARDPATRSNTSVCLTIADPDARGSDGGRHVADAMADLLEREQVAYDIRAYRLAPPGLRIWCGPTVDAADVAALTDWLDWSYRTVTARRGA